MTTPRRSAVARVAAGLLSGAAVSLGYAPVEQGWVVPVALVALVLALRGTSVRLGALVGLAFGVGFLGLLVWWVSVLGLGVFVALVGIQVPFYAAFGAAFALVQRLPAWPVWAACCWVATELLRSLFPVGGFPWGRLAFATVGTPLESWARWVGVAALSGLVFLLAAVVAAAVLRPRARTVAVAAVVALGVVGGGALLPTGLAGRDGSIRVAIVQGGVPGTGANGLGQQRQVLGYHVRATLELAARVDAGEAQRPDAVLWPENASDIDPVRDARAREEITAAARAIGVPILVGAIMDGPTPEQARNVGIVWDPQDGPGQTYDKRHLVPFGEYVPFRPLASRLVPVLDEEIPRDMVAGDRPGTLDLAGVRLGDMMCYDVVFDGVARDAVLDGGRYLVVQTSNATYTGTAQPAQQWQIAGMRAVETGRTVVVPSLNGISGVVAADGREVERTRTGAALVEADVPTADGITWGVRAGVWVERGLAGVAALALVVAVLGALRARRRRREETPADATTGTRETVAP